MSQKIGIAIIVAALVLGGFWLVSQPKLSSDSVGTNASSTSIDLGTGTAVIEDSTGATSTVQVVPQGELPKPVPSLTRAFTPGAGFDATAKKIITDKYNQYVATLTSNPRDVNVWIQLGILRRQAGDSEGAREAWAYAARLNPKASVPHKNLADLATYDFHDPVTAEKEWKIAIAMEPNDTTAYRGLFDLYHLAYPEKAGLAPSVLLQGLAVNPKDVDLMLPLAGYYKKIGDTKNARTYFEKALAEIKVRGGNAQLQTAIEQELKTL